jgi:hypothetical protein
MEEIEHFLDRDFMHFANFAPGLRRFKPGKERDDWMLSFFQRAYRSHDFKGDESLFNERCYQACHYVTLHDQLQTDSQGTREEKIDYLSHELSFDLGTGKWVLRPIKSQRTYWDQMLRGRSERTYGPRHVEDGGGDASEPSPLRSEKPLGPSRYTGDAAQRSSQDKDRGSPAQSPGFAPIQDGHNVDT